MKKLKTSQIVFLALLILLLAVYLVIYLTGTARLGGQPGAPTAAEGYLDLTRVNFAESEPLPLHGEWEVFPGQWLSRDTLPDQSDHWRHLPVLTLSEASGRSTYRLRLRTNTGFEEGMLYFPHLDQGFEIELNGQTIYSETGGQNANPPEFFIGLDFDPRLPVQELVIRANDSAREALFFNTQLMLGSPSKTLSYGLLDQSLSNNIMGLLLALLVCCLVFVAIRPHDAPNTSRNLFNTLLIFHILLSTAKLYYLVGTLVGQSVITGDMFARLQWATLIPAGIVANYVIATLFRKGNIWIGSKIIMCLYGVSSLMIFIVPPEYTETLLSCVFWLYVANLVLFAWHIAEALINRFSKSMLFAALEMFYILVLFTVRMLMLTGQTAIFSALDIGFVPLFFYHIGLYLSEYNRTVKQVEHLNNTLEETVEHRTRQLMAINQRLSDLSVRDALTGAYNRLYFENTIHYLLDPDNAMPDPDPFYLCIADIDFFKNINDTYGHDTGDMVLVDFVSVLSRSIGGAGALARIGGEEFVTILRQGSPGDMFRQADSWRRAIEQHSFINGIRVTASFGVAVYKPGMDVKSLFRLADQMLYLAKQTGRNRVRISTADNAAPSESWTLY